MTHHARLNLVMFATIIGLLVFLYFRPQSQDIQKYSVSSNSAETIQNLRIVRQQKEIVLNKSDDRWYMIEPIQARADERKIIEVLQILTANSHQRFPLADLERFGLNRPNIQLYIDNEYFSFGGFAPTTTQQYMATGSYIYLISPRYAITLSLIASDLISPILLASNEDPVKFELNHLTLELQNGNWSSISRDSMEILNKEIIRHWIHLWRTMRARELTINQELGADFAEAINIKISLQDGQEINLKAFQNETEWVFLRVNEGIGYHFPVDVGHQLLDPRELQSHSILPES